MDARELDSARRTLEGVLAGLGRDDIGVGEVSLGDDGRVHYVLHKSGLAHEAAIDPAALADPQAAMAQVNLALRHVSKPVQRAHIADARD